MKPHERQLSLVAYLVTYRLGRTLEEICRDLPVYGSGEAARKKLQRDRKLLEQSGIPISVVTREGEAEDGNLRYLYQLDRKRVFARPLRLSPTEQEVLGELCRVLEREPDFGLRPLAREVRAKLLAEAPVASMGKNEDGHGRTPSREAWLPELVRALAERRKLRVRYRSMGRDTGEERILQPVRLDLAGGSWMLIAWCESRQAVRYFRPARIEALELLEAEVDDTLVEHFRREAEDLELSGRAWWTGIDPTGKAELRASLLVDSAVLHLLRRDMRGFTCREAARPEGMVLDFAVRDREHFTRWLLGWGRRTRLLGSPELQRELSAWLKAKREAAA